MSSLADHAQEPYDLAIVGGGIVGAGIARDAALRGLRTLLVDQQDFAAGTSSRSTRLLHGGIRYLAQGRIRLVREANREKNLLHRLAPHLSQPLGFIYPALRGGPYWLWQLRLGVRAYDLLCGRNFLGASRGLTRAEIHERAPALNLAGVTGAAYYYDSLTHDARLVFDTLRSAANHGARVFNYAAFEHAERSGARWHCRLRDVQAGTEWTVAARCLFYAAGPWLDRLEGAQTRLRVTKGVHLTFDRERLPLSDAVVVTEGERILFAIPWGDRVIVGTTDTDYAGPLDAPACDAADVTYLLQALRDTFPSAELEASDIRSTWAGLRPLVADSRGGPSDISRRHQILATGEGRWDVAGGKLTTYRLMAEEAVDRAVAYLGGKARPCTTAEEPLVPATVDGPRCGVVPPEPSEELVRHFCDEEWAQRLDDVMVRRTSWSYYRGDHAELAGQAAAWMAAALGWDAARAEREVREYLRRHATGSILAP